MDPIEPIEDHNKMLTESLCRDIFRYILENPSVPYSEVVRVLANVQYSVGLALDHWYADIVEQVGYDVTSKCPVQELHNFLEWPVDDTDWDYGLEIETDQISLEDLDDALEDLGSDWTPDDDLEDDDD